MNSEREEIARLRTENARLARKVHELTIRWTHDRLVHAAPQQIETAIEQAEHRRRAQDRQFAAKAQFCALKQKLHGWLIRAEKEGPAHSLWDAISDAHEILAGRPERSRLQLAELLRLDKQEDDI